MYVFEIPGSQLKDIFPDEDTIVNMLIWGDAPTSWTKYLDGKDISYYAGAKKSRKVEIEAHLMAKKLMTILPDQELHRVMKFENKYGLFANRSVLKPSGMWTVTLDPYNQSMGEWLQEFPTNLNLLVRERRWFL